MSPEFEDWCCNCQNHCSFCHLQNCFHYYQIHSHPHCHHIHHHRWLLPKPPRPPKFTPQPELSTSPQQPPWLPPKFPEVLLPLWLDEAVAISYVDRAFLLQLSPFTIWYFWMAVLSTESWSSEVTKAKPLFLLLPQWFMISITSVFPYCSN